MTLALTVLVAFLLATFVAACGVFALALHRHDPDDDTTAGIFIALGALAAWAFLAVTGLTS
jgi:hypothetical protein